jgi:hypothetical protein
MLEYIAGTVTENEMQGFWTSIFQELETNNGNFDLPPEI